MKKKILFSIIVVTMIMTSMVSIVSAETVSWKNKLYQGTSINYWLHSNVEYTVSIPNAIHKLMYPIGMTNRLVLKQTTVNSSSKMDFHQYDDPYTRTIAFAKSFRKNSSGNYYAMPVSEKDQFDWIYGEVHINDAIMDGFSSAEKEGTLIHEMLHVYGLKDLYHYSNQGSIMYGYRPNGVNNLTSDSNAALNSKY